MLTEADIRRNLKNNPDWEPKESATEEEWALFDRVLAEIEGLDDEDDGDGDYDSDSDEYDFDGFNDGFDKDE